MQGHIPPALSGSGTGDDPTPVYYKLERALQEQIEDGTLGAGDRLPPERRIAQDYNVSLATVRRALQDLVQKGFVHRVQGKGTFVANTFLRRRRVRYYPFVKEFQGSFSEMNIEFLGLEERDGARIVNHHLHLRADQKLYVLTRLLCTGRTPAVFSISYLPRNMFKGLETFKKRVFEKYALYILLEEKFGVSTMGTRELYGAVAAPEFITEALAVPAGHPVLQVEMQALTFRERPYEFRVSYCVTDEKKIRRET